MGLHSALSFFHITTTNNLQSKFWGNVVLNHSVTGDDTVGIWNQLRKHARAENKKRGEDRDGMGGMKKERKKKKGKRREKKGEKEKERKWYPEWAEFRKRREGHIMAIFLHYY